MGRRYNPRAVKMNLQYEVPDAAEALGVTSQTIRLWIKDGLQTLNSKRPTLIMGFHLRQYIERRFRKTRNKLALGEFFCLRCRVARKPFGMLADYEPLSSNRGRLVALCCVCEAKCSRLATEASLVALSRVLEISRPGAHVQDAQGVRAATSPERFDRATPLRAKSMVGSERLEIHDNTSKI